MELYNIYYGFWEGMKEISVGVCLNKYTWLEIWEKKKKSGLFKKTKRKKNLKKNGLEQKQKEKKFEERKEVVVQFELYYVKLVELVLFEKNCAPLVFRNYIVPYISFLHS